MLRAAAAAAALLVLAVLLEQREHARLYLTCVSDRFPAALSGGSARCSKAGSDLLRRPGGYATRGGDRVLLMCPPRAHGFLRRWSYGVTESGVRVLILSPDRIYPYSACWTFLFDPTCGSKPL